MCLRGRASVCRSPLFERGSDGPRNRGIDILDVLRDAGPGPSQAEGDLFLPENILMIATPEVIAKSIKLVDLMGILDLAEKEMGFNAEEDEGLIDPAAEAGGPDAEASEGSLEGSLDRLDDVGGDDGPKA